jgi:acyl-CoA thioesterase YciA
MNDIDDTPKPYGELALQTLAMPANTNFNGDIFGGWLVAQMDLAAAIAAIKETRGRVVTVTIDSMSFLVPVPVGAVVSCYTAIIEARRSSIKINVEVWINSKNTFNSIKVTEGHFVFVSLNQQGRTQRLNKLDKL